MQDVDGVLVACSVRFNSRVIWYYTPMAMAFTRTLPAGVVVYDCMDELSLFHGAPPALRWTRSSSCSSGPTSSSPAAGASTRPRSTSTRAVHAFPSSVDIGHFAAGAQGRSHALRSGRLPRPRIGFFGVIDERLDIDLIARLAAARPD